MDAEGLRAFIGGLVVELYAAKGETKERMAELSAKTLEAAELRARLSHAEARVAELELKAGDGNADRR